VHVVSAEFITSAASAAGVPRDAPHVALVGRSNVGKSTLINALLRQRLARTSAAAGKTRLLNFFRVTFDRFAPVPRLYLVDLPGYGYARGGEVTQEVFRVLLEGYFGGATRPAAVLQLVDARHPGLPQDVAAWDWLRTLSTHAARTDDTRDALTDPLAAAVVATKIDKLSRADRRRALETWTRQLNAPVLPVSAATGEGMTDLWTLIVRLLHLPPAPKSGPSLPSDRTPEAAPSPGSALNGLSARNARNARNGPPGPTAATGRSATSGPTATTAATGSRRENARNATTAATGTRRAATGASGRTAASGPSGRKAPRRRR
jgi:GTP-binding protein